MIPLMKNTFLHEHQTKQALSDFIMQSHRLSMDVKCLEFERAFALYQNCRHAILFNSGGSANLALLQALKNLDILHDGDKVGFSALTWSTNTMPIIQLGMEPIAVDCAADTLNTMSTHLEERLQTTELKAFFTTNALGFTGDLDVIRDLCKARGVILLEDNCESLGSELPAGKAGNFGLASTFSFFVAHHMSTIEGGMVCTNDNDLAEMLRIVRANGWDRNLTAEQQFKWRKKFGVKNEFNAKYTFYDLGYNLRPTEITGFLGLTQLQYLPENIRIRELNYMVLEQAVHDNPDLVQMNHRHMSVLSNFSFPVVCKTPELRDQYLSQFSGAGVEIRPMIAGNIQNQPFYKKYVKTNFDLPGTQHLDQCAFYCGNYPELTQVELEVLRSCLKHYDT
jgi:CDP-6-deoxy-D-xylo-4-hexulose-3-dehydrase